MITKKIFLVKVLIVIAIAGKGFSDYENYAIYSWGDYVVTMGCGTDPEMGTPQAAENMIKRLKKRGFTGVIHRMDWDDAKPYIHWNELGSGNPASRHLVWKIEQAYEKYPVSATISKIAHNQNMIFWGWWPAVFSDGAPAVIEIDGIEETMSWNTERKYIRQNRNTIVIDRKGKKHYGIREYAYPGARSSKVDELVYIARKHNIKAFLAGMRSEAAQMQPHPEHADQFGFNEPVVNDMRAIYGVDILTDPRFDYTDPNFDLHDPMVDKWRRLRGTYLTQFYRELRERLEQVDPDIKIAVQIPGGDYAGPPIGNLHLDWRTWIDEGLIDMLIPYVTLEASLDPNAHKKGYLTYANWGKNESNIYPLSTFREYIDNSEHSEIELIMGGGPYYFFKEPPAGADGWRTDITYDFYNLGWYQLWQQWKRDIDEYGHIKFISQDFEDFPVQSSGYFGAWGLAWYDLDKRKCEGLWLTLGNGENDRPTVQGEAFGSGYVVRLRQDLSPDAEYTLQAGGTDSLVARHWSGRDRSMAGYMIDNAMLNGSGKFNFKVYLPDHKSGLSACVYNDFAAPQYSIGVFIAPGGRLCYIQNGDVIKTDKKIRINEWENVTIEIDIDAMKYSVFTGKDQENIVCRDISYKLSNNGFNQLIFSPTGEKASVCYLDNVELQWIPLLRYTKADKVIFEDDFESYTKDETLISQAVDRTYSDIGETFVIENDMSFGNGVNCLRAKGGENIVVNANAVSDADVVTFDFDIFIRSDQPYIVMQPTESLQSEHQVKINITNSKNETVISLYADEKGIWQFQTEDKYQSSGNKVQYDVWQHLQITVKKHNKTAKIVTQPVGELPYLLVDEVSLDKKPTGLKMAIEPSSTERHISCYDNIAISIQNKD